ncbi:hypothetical protein [Nocardia sp. NPDC050175]|uniref:hypothetical protein n=1 Tax=Nocardia sp. NPDC050175 TaxID=3364317 RepID=UPI0037B007E2
MIDTVIEYLSAYLGAKAAGIASRAGNEADGLVDSNLSKVYDWVKSKLRHLPFADAAMRNLEAHPDERAAQEMVAGCLDRVLAENPELASELAELVENIQQSDYQNNVQSVASKTGPAIGGDVNFHTGSGAAAVQMGDVAITSHPQVHP